MKISQVQAAELGDPHTGGVKGLDDKAVANVRAGVHHDRDLPRGQGHRWPLGPTPAYRTALHHREIGSLAAVQTRRDEPQLDLGAQPPGHRGLAPLPRDAEADELHNGRHDPVDSGRAASGPQRDDVPILGPTPVASAPVLARGCALQPAGERGQLLDTRRGLIHPTRRRPAEPQRQPARVGPGGPDRAATIQNRAQILPDAHMLDIAVVDDGPPLPPVQR